MKTQTLIIADMTKAVSVRIAIPSSLGTVAKAIDWWTGKDLALRKGSAGTLLVVEIPGGDCAAIEFVME